MHVSKPSALLACSLKKRRRARGSDQDSGKALHDFLKTRRKGTRQASMGRVSETVSTTSEKTVHAVG